MVAFLTNDLAASRRSVSETAGRPALPDADGCPFGVPRAGGLLTKPCNGTSSAPLNGWAQRVPIADAASREVVEAA